MAYDLNSLYQQLQNIQQQYNNIQTQTTTNNIPMIQQSRQIKYVEGINGARVFLTNLPNNTSEIIMDSKEDIFYVVSKDANGTPAKIMQGRFTIEETTEQEEPVFLTRKDLDEFKEELKQFLNFDKNHNVKGESKT